jgi:hypothetical protein
MGMEPDRVARQAHGRGNLGAGIGERGARSQGHGGIQHAAEDAQEQAPGTVFAPQEGTNANRLLGREVNGNTHGELYRQLWRQHG